MVLNPKTWYIVRGIAARSAPHYTVPSEVEMQGVRGPRKDVDCVQIHTKVTRQTQPQVHFLEQRNGKENTPRPTAICLVPSGPLREWRVALRGERKRMADKSPSPRSSKRSSN